MRYQRSEGKLPTCKRRPSERSVVKSSSNTSGGCPTSRRGSRHQITVSTKKLLPKIEMEVALEIGCCSNPISVGGLARLQTTMTFCMLMGYRVLVSLQSILLIRCSFYLACLNNFQGKTTLMSAVIERLLDENRVIDGHSDSLVVYFYFKHKQPSKITHNSLLRAVMEQIVTRDPVLCDYLFDKLGSMEGVNLRSTKTLESLITTSLGNYRSCFLVLDGLDEAASGEAVKSVSWLLSLVDGGFPDNHSLIRVLFCGQRDGILDRLLSNRPSISLEAYPGHADDIRLYCTNISTQIRQKFGISSDFETDIIYRVTNNANGKYRFVAASFQETSTNTTVGMFLYARVVLNNLLSQTKISRLKKEMEPGVFPSGMDRA